MSAGQAFVGIDAGTTGCTVMIFDESGNRLGQGYQEYPCTSPRAGWIEQDVEEVWQGICAATKQAVAAAALPDSAYKSVGFSSQRGTFILLDEDKNPIAPSIVWNDGRALEYQEEFGKEISPDDYQTHTGMQLSPLWSAAKIAWLRDNEPELFRHDALVRQRPGVLPAPPRRRGVGHRPGVADAQRHARHREARLERPRPRAVRHRPRPGAAGRHPVGSGRDGLGRPRADAPGCPRASRSAGVRATSSAPRSAPAWWPGAGRVHRRHRRASWSPTSTASTGSRAATCGGAATPCPAPGTSRAARSRSARR